MPKRFTDANEILDYLDRDDPEIEKLISEAAEKFDVAQIIYDARTAAGLTQAELAKRIRTTQSVIARLEDANYEGHSLSMLHRIAAALGQRIEIRFLPAEKPARKRP